jgi:hypothetical protein
MNKIIFNEETTKKEIISSSIGIISIILLEST